MTISYCGFFFKIYFDSMERLNIVISEYLGIGYYACSNVKNICENI